MPEFGTHYDDYTFWTFAATAVRQMPEPATAWLFVMAVAAGLSAARRRTGQAC